MPGEGQEGSPISAGDKQVSVERVDQTSGTQQDPKVSSQSRGPLSFLAKAWGAVAGRIERTAVKLDKAGVDPNRIIPPATGVYPRSEQASSTQTPSNEPSQS